VTRRRLDVRTATLALGLLLGAVGRAQAEPLNPLDFTSLGTLSTMPGTYTINASGPAPTLTSSGGTMFTGVVSGGSRCSISTRSTSARAQRSASILLPPLSSSQPCRWRCYHGRPRPSPERSTSTPLPPLASAWASWVSLSRTLRGLVPVVPLEAAEAAASVPPAAPAKLSPLIPLVLSPEAGPVASAMATCRNCSRWAARAPSALSTGLPRAAARSSWAPSASSPSAAPSLPMARPAIFLASGFVAAAGAGAPSMPTPMRTWWSRVN
jgi:hypothetical protein